MIRYEIFFLAGLLCGVVLGAAGSSFWRRWLDRRDAALRAAKIRVQLRSVTTDDLLDEVSKRDDVGQSGRGT